MTLCHIWRGCEPVYSWVHDVHVIEKEAHSAPLTLFGCTLYTCTVFVPYNHNSLFVKKCTYATNQPINYSAFQIRIWIITDGPLLVVDKCCSFWMTMGLFVVGSCQDRMRDPIKIAHVLFSEVMKVCLVFIFFKKFLIFKDFIKCAPQIFLYWRNRLISGRCAVANRWMVIFYRANWPRLIALVRDWAACACKPKQAHLPWWWPYWPPSVVYIGY
jgi:hypothetical protein